MRIIAEQDIYRQTLQEALSVIDLDVRTYAKEADVKEYENDILLFVLDDHNNQSAKKLSQSQSVFAIGEVVDSDHDFIQLFQPTVRLGAMVQSIASYLKHKAQQQSLTPVKMGGYTLDPRSNQLTSKKDSDLIKLTEKEQDILLFLYAQRDAPVSRQALLDEVWGYAQDVETHTLETHIYRLRQKIEQDPTEPSFLMTNDHGYYLNLEI